MKRKRLGTLSALVGIAAILGNDMTDYRRNFNDRRECPSCNKGKLVGKNGVRYCQRCAYMEDALS